MAPEVAEICHVSIWTVYRWCESGRIAARPSTAGRGWLISLPSVREFMREEYDCSVVGRNTSNSDVNSRQSALTRKTRD